MDKNHKKSLFCVYEEVYEELYVIDTLLKLTKDFCLDLEFKGEYYGAPENSTLKISAERNNYINMLGILSEKISNIKRLNLSAEQYSMLEQNSDN